MSDLISRSELYMNELIRRKDVLELFPTNDCSDKMVGLYERVLDIPAAYDVEKVVEELLNKREIYRIREIESLRKGEPLNIGVYLAKQASIEDCIEIVKRGGAE